MTKQHKEEKKMLRKETKNSKGLIIQKGEKLKLYKLCKKYNITILYEELFEDNNDYYMWGINDNGIALIGTVLLNYLSSNNQIIFKSLDEFESYLKKI